MTLNWIKLFLAVAHHGSVTRAANALHVSQSSISHQLRLLQQELGVTLYEKVRAGIELNESGRTWLAGSKAILLSFENLKAELGVPKTSSTKTEKLPKKTEPRRNLQQSPIRNDLRK